MASITIHNLLLCTTNESWQVIVLRLFLWYSFWYFRSIKSISVTIFFQVVNLKEARDFSSNKKYIYVFKVLYHLSFYFLVCICIVLIWSSSYMPFLYYVSPFIRMYRFLLYVFFLNWAFLCCLYLYAQNNLNFFSRNWNGNHYLLIFCLILTCSRMLL